MPWARAVWFPCGLGSVLAHAVLADAGAQVPQLDGPLPVRNQHPAQLTVMHLDPRPASTLYAGEVSLRGDAAYSSLFLAGAGSGNTFVMDGEYLRVRLALGAGITDSLEFGIELPLAYTSGGFMDSFLSDYHDALNLPNEAHGLPKNRWHVEATSSGNTVFSVDKYAVELMDVPLTLQWQMLGERTRGFALALRGGVELPTGSETRGFGNGGVDYGGGALLQWRSDWLGLYGHAQHTFAATPDRAQAGGLEFADVTSLGLATEIMVMKDLAALVQVEWETSTLRNLGFERVASDQVTLWLGGRLDLGDGFACELGFGEDLQSYVSPDFTMWIGLAWQPHAYR